MPHPNATTEDGAYTITLDAEFDSALYIFTDCDDIYSTCLGAKDTTGTETLVVPGEYLETVIVKR